MTLRRQKKPSGKWCLRVRRDILFWGNADAGTALIDRHPDTRFIIDHLGIMQPARRPRRRSPGPTCRRYWTSPSARTR
jgi:hypothetical protein